jgi:hypothetical protein
VAEGKDLQIAKQIVVNIGKSSEPPKEDQGGIEELEVLGEGESWIP